LSPIAFCPAVCCLSRGGAGGFIGLSPLPGVEGAGGAAIATPPIRDAVPPVTPSATAKAAVTHLIAFFLLPFSFVFITIILSNWICLLS
jgi:hypothetical protein